MAEELVEASPLGRAPYDRSGTLLGDARSGFGRQKPLRENPAPR